MTHSVYLALGSNQGDRLGNLHTAISKLTPAVRVTAVSPVYETPPWGYTDQPAFLNQVVQGETDHSPLQLLVFLKQLETDVGRVPNFRNGPRVIDLDIIFYDDLVFDSPELTLPHPRLRGRAFVLAPLADLAPDLLHPVLRLPVQALLEETDQSGIVRYQQVGDALADKK